MLTSDDLGALRVAAAMCHLVPGLRCRVYDGDRCHIAVASFPTSAPPGNRSSGVLTLPPCAFRRAVAQAHQAQGSGRPLQLRGSRSGGRLRVELLAADPVRQRAGGLFGVAVGSSQLWSFATTLHHETAFELGLELVAAADLRGVRALGIRRDEALEVSIAYAETAADANVRQQCAVVDLLEALMARWATHELLASLTSDRPA